MKLSISNIAWNIGERKKIYKLLKSKNIEGIEIAPKLFLHNHKNYIKPDKEMLKKNFLEIKDFKYKLISMQSLFFNTEECYLFGNKQQQSNFIKHFKNIIHLAHRLKIPNLVFGSPKNKNIPDKMIKKDAINLFVKIFRILAREAKKFNIIISLESNPRIYGSNFLNDIYETHKLVKLVNRKNIKLILDTGELLVNKNININKIIKRTINQINHVHISEPYLDKIKNVIFFKNIIALLKKHKYKKWISIEMRNTKKNNFFNIEKSIQRIQNII